MIQADPQPAASCLNRLVPLRLFVFLLLWALVPSTLGAQYFGQNKVRYGDFEFKILKTLNLDIYYYDREHEAAAIGGRMAERWAERLSKVLDWKLPINQVVIFYDNHQAFEGTSAIPGFIGESTGGVTEALKRRVVVPFAGPLADTDHVLGHELVHAFQYDMAKRSAPEAGAVGSGILALPLWFVEGMAEYLSVGSHDAMTAMWMRDAVARNEIPPLRELDNPKYFPYRWGQAFWAYAAGRYGDGVVGKALRSARGGSAEAAIAHATGASTEQINQDWKQSLIDHYSPILNATEPPDRAAHSVIPADPKGSLHVGPVVSPDGSRMILFSQRDLFSVDLYLADAATGAIEERITTTATDPHIDSLEFINSAGSWSTDGTQFVYTTANNGKPQVEIYDVPQDRTVQKIPLPDFGGVYNPTWSPDGQRIAFSALIGGLIDLYVVDVGSKKLERLTSDVFADLQPAWSPDGSTLAFVTDRFTSDPSAVAFGQPRLGILDLTSRAIREVPGFPSGKHINPQWAPDGRSLYFVSDRDGISNIYRVSLEDGHQHQITNLQTGVSGITALSPALSVASKSGKIIFSVFVGGRYGIFSLDSPQAFAGRAPREELAGLNAGDLPPVARDDSEVRKMLASPVTGLVSSADFTKVPYRPKLTLDYIAPPQVGVGVSNFGPMVGGGTALYFSDLLGYHNLMITAFETTAFSDFSKILNNVSALAAYQNQRHRWTWGVIGGQTPFLTGSQSQAVGVLSGLPVLLDQSLRVWQVNRQISGFLAYPFNRARRIEFSTGYQRISYNGELHTTIMDLTTGQTLGQQKEDVPIGKALNMSTSSAALVYDTSIFGGTSPIMGQRYRLEFGASLGTLNYTSALADYRKYVRLARPATLAFRLMHYGRYGGGANDSRLEDLFLGYPALIRGYNSNSFSASECGLALQRTGACPVFDRLLGSRIAVANAELRTQIFGPLGIVKSPGVPPVEFAPFYDAGIAWHRQDSTPRRPVSSEGATLRVNLLGYAVAQISFTHPNNRPMKQRVWEFSLLAGF